MDVAHDIEKAEAELNRFIEKRAREAEFVLKHAEALKEEVS